MRHCIHVACIEFDEGGHTLWVQGEHGTVLRIKLGKGKITSKACASELGPSHADIFVPEGDLKICRSNADSMK